MHLESREAVHQLDLEIGECSGTAKNGELHPSNKQIKRKRIAEPANVAPLHQRCDFLTEPGNRCWRK